MLITSGQVRETAGELVGDELIVMPVRHHSPACALQVRRMIEERRPSVVLVEGPRGFSSLVPLLTHPDATMPLAVYTYAVRSTSEGEERWAGYYPFCDYSPELVALREAAARGIPARFIDLDYPEQRLAQEAEDVSESLLDEQHFRHSKGLRLLAERLGCQDDEDLWELLFEADATSTSPVKHLERVTAYCLLARSDHSTADLEADGTAAREAEMAWYITEALRERAAGDGPVLVVVGGFHAVALPALLKEPPARPRYSLRGITADSALIRYTFERLERLNGYAAGMTSPAWHQRLWNELTTAGGEDPRTTALLTTLLDIATELRVRHRVPLAVSTVAAAFGQALELAELRDRPAPLRSDLLDAITSCFVKGDIDVEGLRVRAAARRILTGDAIGVVPPGAGTPPLAAAPRRFDGAADGDARHLPECCAPRDQQTAERDRFAGCPLRASRRGPGLRARYRTRPVAREVGLPLVADHRGSFRRGVGARLDRTGGGHGQVRGSARCASGVPGTR
jgi:hypothetical protein